MIGQISKYFTWREALWLPLWNRQGNTEEDGFTPENKANLEHLFAKMDLVRELFGKPIIVHCAWRPFRYNQLVGGVNKSAHLAKGKEAAVDFHVEDVPCLAAKVDLLEHLENLELRMEDNGMFTEWIHLDTRITNGNLFFKP